MGFMYSWGLCIHGVYVFMGFMYSWGNIKRVLLSVAKLLVCDRVLREKGP